MIRFRFIVLLSFLASVNLYAQVTINGYNKFYYENGKISSEGTMRDGKPDGYWKNYYDNGKLKIEGNRKNFQLDSIWKFYDVKGRITKSISYKEGKKDGPSIVYDTLQKIVTTETYIQDVKQGLQRNFYKNGKTKSIIPYVKGKPDGTAYEYSIDSLITAIIVYKGGILQSFEKINQKDASNKKQGIWKEFYDNLEVKKQMKFNDDSLDGYVMEFDKKGNLTSTKKFNNGKQILKAPEIANVEVYRDVYEDGTLKYEGVYSDGVPIGSHYTYKQKYQCDSSIFLRDDTARVPVYIKRLVCRNVPVPDSCIEYFDGIVVAKGKVDSARNRIGVWTEYHNTGEFRGKGVYKDGNRTGDWEFFYASGKLEQKGKYDKKGRTQGVWKWFYESGALMREENYVNGKREGQMTDYDEKGKIILQGTFVDNNMEGTWVYETPDYKEIGNYVNGERDSVWKSFYMPGKIKRYEGRFSNGEEVGTHTMYYDNGKKMYTGNYVAGMRDGDWKFYDEMGINYLTITYKNDIEIKWMGEKIRPTYEESLRTYNIKIDENKTQTIRK
ncbi:MAG: toxin-antitoxin system YwqK family antitoxin [Bacteroidia bacterium]